MIATETRDPPDELQTGSKTPVIHNIVVWYFIKDLLLIGDDSKSAPNVFSETIPEGNIASHDVHSEENCDPNDPSILVVSNKRKTKDNKSTTEGSPSPKRINTRSSATRI